MTKTPRGHRGLSGCELPQVIIAAAKQDGRWIITAGQVAAVPAPR